jgi:hypothetical protein
VDSQTFGEERCECIDGCCWFPMGKEPRDGRMTAVAFEDVGDDSDNASCSYSSETRRRNEPTLFFWSLKSAFKAFSVIISKLIIFTKG